MTEPSPPNAPASAVQSDFERGHIAGVIAARLAGHDAHLAVINGHLAVMASQLTASTMAIQRLADQAEADAQTRVTTAAAVEKARKEAAGALESERLVRRERSELTWTPMSRGLAVLAGLGVIASIIVGIIALSTR